MKLLRLLVVVLFGSMSVMANEYTERSDNQELNLSEGASDGYHFGYFGSYGYPYAYSFGYPYAYSYGYPFIYGYVRSFNDYHLCIYFPDLPECSQMQGPAMGTGHAGAGFAGGHEDGEAKDNMPPAGEGTMKPSAAGHQGGPTGGDHAGAPSASAPNKGK